MEKHVPSIEVCKRLKEAGFPQDTENCWAYDWDLNEKKNGEKAVHAYWELDYFGTESFELCAAPILTEILEQLPEGTSLAKWMNSYSIISEVGPFADDNPAEAAALLWLELRRLLE